jgi:hypothetical protein
LIEFKLATLAGFVLIPFGLFGKTAFMAERVLGLVISLGVKGAGCHRRRRLNPVRRVGEYFKPGAMRPSSQSPSPVRFAFPDTSE